MNLRYLTSILMIVWVSVTISAQKLTMYYTTPSERWIEKNILLTNLRLNRQMFKFTPTVCYKMLSDLEVHLMNWVGMPCNICHRKNVIKLWHPYLRKTVLISP